MLDKREIDEAIQKMEDQFENYSHVERLAHLCAIRDRYFPESEEEQELQEIFPALKVYQSEQTTSSLERLCCEVSDFIEALYASTRSNRQREVIHEMLDRCRGMW